MAKKTEQIMQVLDGSCHFTCTGLHNYHQARLVMNANRRTGTARRANAMRKALKSYNVMVSYGPDSINGPIRLWAPQTRRELILDAA